MSTKPDLCQLVHKLGNYMVSETTLGQGTYAKVRLACHIASKELYAMKIIKKPEMEAKHYTRIKREVENLKGLKHPHIVQLHDVFQTKRFICIVMEYATGGDLFEFLRSRPDSRLSEGEALRIFKQMLEAVDHCHKKHVVHRDLKPENILLDDKLNVKIADFGFSRTFDPDGSLLSTCCGSVGYAAPELLIGEKYIGPAADVWSLGVILYTSICGTGPFQREDEGISKKVEERMLSGNYIRSPLLSEFMVHLFNRIFEVDPAARITTQGLMLIINKYELTKTFANPSPDDGDGTSVDSGESDQVEDSSQSNVNTTPRSKEEKKKSRSSKKKRSGSSRKSRRKDKEKDGSSSKEKKSSKSRKRSFSNKADQEVCSNSSAVINSPSTPPVEEDGVLSARTLSKSM